MNRRNLMLVMHLFLAFLSIGTTIVHAADMPVKLQITDLKQLLQQFSDNAITVNKPPSPPNDLLAKRALTITWRKIRALGKPGIEALASLLDHPDDAVRMEAAIRLLPYRTDKAKAVLQSLKKHNKLPCYKYKPEYTLSQWDSCPWSDEGASAKKSLTLQELKAQISKAGFDAHADQLLKAVRDAIVMKSEACDEDEIPVGSSKLAGMPDLPPDTAWPLFQNKPMSFICQLRLDQVAALDTKSVLPKEGMLYFFYNGSNLSFGEWPKDRGSGMVLYFNGDQKTLQRRAFPDKLEWRYYPCALTFSRQLVLPSVNSELVERLRLPEKAIAQYRSLLDNIACMQGGPLPSADLKGHKLLGYPDDIQFGDVLQDCPKLKAGYVWEQLLQVTSDEESDMFWGVNGCLYYCIPQGAGTGPGPRQFENAWVVVQCG